MRLMTAPDLWGTADEFRYAYQTLTGDEPVSMNFWGFTPTLFGHLRIELEKFLKSQTFAQSLFQKRAMRRYARVIEAKLIVPRARQSK